MKIKHIEDNFQSRKWEFMKLERNITPCVQNAETLNKKQNLILVHENVFAAIFEGLALISKMIVIQSLLGTDDDIIAWK